VLPIGIADHGTTNEIEPSKSRFSPASHKGTKEKQRAEAWSEESSDICSRP
jgi:hypothetical protein